MGGRRDLGGESDPLADTEIDREPGSGSELAAITPDYRGAASAAHSPLPKEGKIGRFVVLEHLGAGGMGVVVAAYDPQLDRRVALKMLRTDVSAAHAARLEREAKGMAQLTHPNVVVVHDTGTWDGRLYIAMEFVEGQTLGAWLRGKQRSRQEILDVLMQAGRGLAAAHDVGLVHRDFKPDNVLVGKDGRARVSDFGLVSSAGERIAGASSAGSTPSPDVAAHSQLTTTGAVMGTPLYMAPEQHTGQVADAKADQFAYCVTLWQALCGETPYRADSYEDLFENVTSGKLRPFRGRVPTSIRSILLRGLSRAPADRFPSMRALLDALEAARRPPRWPFVVAGVVLLGGGASGLYALARNEAADPCAQAAHTDGAWDASRKAQLEQAMKKVAGGEESARRLTLALDRTTAAWAKKRRATCEATSVKGTQSAELLDLRMRCLDRHLVDVKMLVDRVLEEPNRETLAKAADAAGLLPDLAECDDDARLRAQIPLPADPQRRARIAALEADLAEGESYDRLGRYARAREVATEVTRQAPALEYPPLEAHALLLRAGGEYRTGELAAAEKSYRETAEAAARARDDRRLAQSWIDLMAVITAQGRYDDALQLAPIARTAAERVSEDVKLGARFANGLAGIYMAQSKYKEAKVEYERALELVKKDGPNSPLYGHALNNLATVLWYTGEGKQAAVLFEEARQKFVAQLGPRHPTVAYVHRNLGDLAATDGKIDEAIAHYREAAAIWEAAHGPDHIDVALAYDPLTYALVRKGDAAGALAAGEKALAIREAKLGKDHPQIATVLISLADADQLVGTPEALKRASDRLARALEIQGAKLGPDNLQLAYTLERVGHLAARRGNMEEALENFKITLEIRKKALGPEHSDVAYSHLVMAEAEIELGRHEAAFADYEAAYALWKKAEGSEKDPDVAKAYAGMAVARLEQGRTGAALTMFEEAIAMARKAGANPGQLGWIRFGHARALWKTKKADARAEALEVKDTLVASENAELEGQIEAWLKTH